jgi:hypothetical protein
LGDRRLAVAFVAGKLVNAGLGPPSVAALAAAAAFVIEQHLLQQAEQV